MKKKPMFSEEEAGRQMQVILRMLQANTAEIHARSESNPHVQKLCTQLNEFARNLLEWGGHRGNIEIWASFVPSMFDYSSTDELYGGGDNASHG